MATSLYQVLTAAKRIKKRLDDLVAHGLPRTTPNATDIDTAVLVATSYALTRYHTPTSSAAMVAASLAWRVAHTCGCSDNYISKLLDVCANSYRLAEQDLTLVDQSLLNDYGYPIPAIDSDTDNSEPRRYNNKLPELAYTMLKALVDTCGSGSTVEGLIAHLDLNYASGINDDT
jgi:hypothetical protein